MDITKILNPRYLFIENPFPMNDIQRNVLIVVFAIFTLAAIITALWRLKKNQEPVTRKILSKLSTFAITMAAIGWVLFFMRQVNVYFFSRRFFFIFWSIGTIIWFIFILKYILKKAPQEKKNLEEKREFEKYLPRTKKLKK